MRPSGVTPLASTMMSPAPEQARFPRCMRCQSVMLPSTAEYWHIGEMLTRLGSVTPPSWIGSNSLGGGNGDAPFFERFPYGNRELRRARLVPVQAHRVGGHRDALSGQADNHALLDHAQGVL